MALGFKIWSPCLRTGNFPPKTWVPRRAKIPRNRKRRTRRDTMASIELINEAKRFWSDLQYLKKAQSNAR